jgi:hypothetical protein
MYNVRLVCEGSTDHVVLEAVLFAHLNSPDFRVSRIQPDESRYGGDAGPHGGGWKGVRGWCQSVRDAGGIKAVGALPEDVDLLVIHIDADIAAALEGKRPRFVRRKGKDLKKIVFAYRDAIPLLSAAWGDLTNNMWSAKRLQQGLSRWVPVST